MEVIGETENKLLIILKTIRKTPGSFELQLFNPDKSEDDLTLLLKCNLSPERSIIQASIQVLTQTVLTSQSLLTLVYKDAVNTSEDEVIYQYSAKLFLLENLNQSYASSADGSSSSSSGDSSPNASTSTSNCTPKSIPPKFASIIILEEIDLVKPQETPLRVHLLPTIRSNLDLDEVSREEAGASTLSINQIISYKNQIVALSLEECITIYQTETLPMSAAGSKIEILSSDCLAKCFWWAQWVPQYQYLAFAHTRRDQQSTIDEDDAFMVKRRSPILSVFQFHEKLARESVLNIPLDSNAGNRRQSAAQIATQFPKLSIISNPMILSTDGESFVILSHSSGSVYLFQISVSTPQEIGANKSLVYQVHLLHHNKKLTITVDLSSCPNDLTTLKIGVSLFLNGQYLVVAGYPYFLHLLDVGPRHEPSHHLIFDWKSLKSLATDSELILISSQDKEQSISFIFENLHKSVLEFKSTLLIPLLEASDVNFRLAVVHFLLVHLSDLNAVKRIIYEAGKNLSNLHLTELFQEFVTANSFVQTRKQLMSNMESFLHLIPYCSLGQAGRSLYSGKTYTIELTKTPSDVRTTLLSPSQRIFPHTTTDIWTSLYGLNTLLTKSTRFSHRHIAEKLLLSLQCYQPETLSRATTPMSPSSPMVCQSMGDLASLFGKRGQELQLPFLEQESCTANKQEYVFSINLRELSMHLLKERKEWAVHGQTVAGKYMNALVDSARLLCHLLCLTLHLQPTRNKDKGFHLIDALDSEKRLKLFMLLENYSIALGVIACPLPQGFTPFFAYLGYRVLNYDQFLWHIRSGAFDLQIDLVKTIMSDLSDSEEENVSKKLHLISLLPKSRANRVLNTWSHPKAICLRARQHSSDLLNGVKSLARKSAFTTQANRIKIKGGEMRSKESRTSPLDSFFQLLTAKANASDIDLGLLTEATMLSMKMMD